MEAVERQQLVEDDCEGDTEEEISSLPLQHFSVKAVPVTGSPVFSNKVFSSGETSQGSASRSGARGTDGHSSAQTPGESARLMFVNERKSAKDQSKVTARPRKHQKAPIGSFAARPLRHHSFLSEVHDVRHLESALLGLLEDFHSGKLRAFGKGCSMEQMTDIREQQERLARLHFDLGADTDMLGSTGDAMEQLVSHLEQLSVSIEQLHSSHNDKP